MCGVHPKLSYHKINCIHFRYQSWRLGLFNLPGFNCSALRSPAHCCACNTAHACDVYGALVSCGSPVLAQWRDNLLHILPWSATLMAWWHDNVTTFAERRNLFRHLVPMTLYSRLAAGNELTPDTTAKWKKSIFSFVNTLLSLVDNLSPDAYKTVVPCRPQKRLSAQNVVSKQCPAYRLSNACALCMTPT